MKDVYVGQRFLRLRGGAVGSNRQNARHHQGSPNSSAIGAAQPQKAFYRVTRPIVPAAMVSAEICHRHDAPFDGLETGLPFNSWRTPRNQVKRQKSDSILPPEGKKYAPHKNFQLLVKLLQELGFVGKRLMTR